MSVWVKAIEAARMAVKMPIAATRTMTSEALWKIRLQRATRYTPALTIVAAWINAETGVGPSIASGSQTWSGNWALLPTAPQRISRAMAICHSCGMAPILAKTACMLSVPIWVQMAMMPRAKPMSPTRLTRKAFLAASAAERRVYQKPINR